METNLNIVMSRLAGEGRVSALQRLSGGASMESWSFDFAGSSYVLRRAPSEEFVCDRPYDLATEAALVQAVRSAGVHAPEVAVVLRPEDGIGAGYVMRRVEAEADPAKIVAAPHSDLAAQLGRELARIHALPAAAIPSAVPRSDAADGLAELKRKFLGYGGNRPVFALAIRWCEDNLPAPIDPVFLHGDYRMGNVMVDADGLAAVLDWELAHFGDPHEDLAYGCMTVWRFGELDRPAFGVGGLDDYFDAYESISGFPIDPARFRFWLIYRTLWWGLGCLELGEAWRTGADPTVERVVIGRRAAEQELDLLRLLEEEAPKDERDRPLPSFASAASPPQGEPSTREIVAAVRNWLGEVIRPEAEGHRNFQAAVAMNALGIAMRDLDGGVRIEDRELAEAILAGSRTLAETGLLARLRRLTLGKCAIDSPKYPALARARVEWGG